MNRRGKKWKLDSGRGAGDTVSPGKNLTCEDVIERLGGCQPCMRWIINLEKLKSVLYLKVSARVLRREGCRA
ncbi:hypothetical protein BD779DRAFT_1540851 [Infundibulicybe gibba]|nr:hypothetical protein BD779DRAFT_1540851 [Infundibulicybe gibba]